MAVIHPKKIGPGSSGRAVRPVYDREATMTEANEEVVRRNFAAYREGDRATAEGLVAEDFVFTSPQDDHIDRAAFFEQCFPTSERFISQELKRVAPTGDD